MAVKMRIDIGDWIIKGIKMESFNKTNDLRDTTRWDEVGEKNESAKAIVENKDLLLTKEELKRVIQGAFFYQDGVSLSTVAKRVAQAQLSKVKANYTRLDKDQSLPKSPYVYCSKNKRTAREAEESFCDIVIR